MLVVVSFEVEVDWISFFFGLGVDAVKDKVDEKKAEVSKDANKQSAENEAKSLVETVKEKAAGA